MEKILYTAMCAILFLCCSSSDESEANSQSPFTLPDKAIVLAEQASKSVVILDACMELESGEGRCTLQLSNMVSQS